MTRSAALAVALVALAACDSATPVDDPIVGTWSVVSAVQSERATVDRAQSILDALGPIDSGVTISGSESARLDRLGYVSRYGDGLGFSLLSFDPSTGLPPARGVTLSVVDQTGYTALSVDVQGEEYVGYVPDVNDGLFTRDGWTYRFNDATLRTYDGTGRTVQLSGAVTFATRALAAGRPTVVNSNENVFGNAYRLTYTFEPDGTLVVREGGGNQLLERVGTWTRDGDRVVLRRPAYGVDGTEVLEFAVSIVDGALVLTNDLTTSACLGYCLRGYEQTYGIAPGTLVAFDVVYESRFRRGEGASALANAQAGGAQAPISPSLRERLLLGPVE